MTDRPEPALRGDERESLRIEEAFAAWAEEVGHARHDGHADLLREGVDGTVGA